MSPLEANYPANVEVDGSPAEAGNRDSVERLQAENAALRSEVERLRQKYEERLEPPATPRRTKASTKEPEQFALVGPGPREEVAGGPSDEAWDNLGAQLCRILEERRAGSRWRYYRDVHLVPEGMTFFYAADALRKMWGPAKDEPVPPDPRAFRRLTVAEQDERDALYQGLLRRIDETLERSETLHSAGHQVAAVGLLKHVDLLLARFNLARGREDAGDPDWRATLADTETDAKFEAWIEEQIAAGE